jgi:opacity protein-like surface antigen
MRVKILLVLLLVTVLLGNIQLNGEGLSVSGTIGVFMPSDANYKVLYGSSNIMPGVKMAINLSDSLYVWGSYSMGTFSGESVMLKVPMKCKRSFLNFGAGFSLNMLRPVTLFLEVGGALANSEEESFGDTNNGSKTGLVVNGGMKIHILKSLFVHVTAGYIMADTQINDKDFKLGGMMIGGGLGFSF